MISDRGATPVERLGQRGLQQPGPLVALLAAAYFLAYVDRMLMIVFAEGIKHEFLLSDSQLALLTGGAFAFMYGVLSIFGGWLLDRGRRVTIIAVAMVLWSVMTTLCGLATGFGGLALARAGVGVGEAIILPGGMALISDMYPKAKRSLPTAIFMAGGMAGILCAFGIGAWVGPAENWRIAFLLGGAPGLLLALVMVSTMREPPRERSPQPASVLNANTFQLVLGNKPLVVTLAGMAIGTFGSAGMMQWLPIFFARSHHMSHAQLALLFGPALAGGLVVGVLIGGWLGVKLGHYSVSRLLAYCAVPLFAVVPLYWIVLLTPTLPLALAFTFIATLAVAGSIPIASTAWQTLCDPRARGTAAGLHVFANTLIGAALLPFAVGVLSDALHARLGTESLRYALAAGVIFLLLSGGLFLYGARLVRAGETQPATA